MTQSSMRLLTLLSLLQAEPYRTGTELSERLSVSRRTVRSDVERLRELGYAIEGVKGSAGGYRLGSGGTAIPPLVLDADEAIAVAIGLHAGVNCIMGGMEEVSLQALSKLERMLPSGVRRQVRNLGHFVVPMPTENAEPVPTVNPSVLTVLASGCDRCERLRFAYRYGAVTPGPDQAAKAPPRTSQTSEAAPQARARPGAGPTAARARPLPPEAWHDVEPYLLINRHHRWYLLAFDPASADWRIFRADGIRLGEPPWGARFTPRPLPETDVHSYVSRRLPGAHWKLKARVTVEAPAERIRPLVASAEGTVEPLDTRRCTAVIGGEAPAAIAAVLTRFDATFTIEDPPEFARYAEQLAERFRRASEALKVREPQGS